METKGFPPVECRPTLPNTGTIPAVPAVPVRPLQQLGSGRQHKPQGCGKSTKGGGQLGDHRGTLGAQCRIRLVACVFESIHNGSDLLNELPHRGGNALAEVVSRSSRSRTHLDPRLVGLRPTKLHKIKNLHVEIRVGPVDQEQIPSASDDRRSRLQLPNNAPPLRRGRSFEHSVLLAGNAQILDSPVF